MQRIVDRMSDSFLVISDDGNITDFNDTFLKTFELQAEHVRNKNFIQFMEAQKLAQLDTKFITSILDKCKVSGETMVVKRELEINNHYFNVEASRYLF